MLEDERHLVRAHLEDGARALAAGVAVAEAGVEEAGVVDAELADQRVVRDHLGGIAGRHAHRLLRREDVELGRIEDQAAARRRAHRLPVLVDLVVADPVDVDAGRRGCAPCSR